MLRRLAAAVLLLSLAAVLAIAAWPQALSLQYSPVVAQVVSLRAVAASGAVVMAVVLLLVMLVAPPFRRIGAAMVTLLVVFVAVNGAVLASRGLGGTDSAVASGDQVGGLTVLSWNTLGDAPGAAAIADLAIESGADIVTLPETTEDTAIEVAGIMKAAGSPMWVHHIALDDELKAQSTALLTSVELGQYSVDTTRGNTGVVPTVIATPDSGTGPTIIAAHPVAPIPGYLDTWRSDLEWLQDACTGENIIMAGDLNATVDHLDDLGNAPGRTIGDCVDAAQSTGSAAVGTWPTDLPALLGTPIDHVMATPNWTATSTSVILDRDAMGSDHRPIVAHLEPAG